jgi:hypothetical protein
MDTHYNWSNPEFRDECGESLNLAVNAVVDVLHTLYNEAHHEHRGDLNGDGQITSADVVIALRMVVRGGHNDAADLNGDRQLASLSVGYAYVGDAGVKTYEQANRLITSDLISSRCL